MNALKQLRIGSRLGIAFAVVLALMLVVAVVSVRGIYRVAAGLETVYLDRTIPLAQLGELNNLSTRNRLIVVEMLRAPGFDEIKRRSDELGANLKRGQQVLDAYLATHLTEREKDLAQRFATRDIDRFAGVAWREGAGGAPVLDGTAATFECANRSQYEEGDHVIFVGAVERCTARAGAQPLIFHGGRYFTELPL